MAKSEPKSEYILYDTLINSVVSASQKDKDNTSVDIEYHCCGRRFRVTPDPELYDKPNTLHTLADWANWAIPYSDERHEELCEEAW